MAMASDSGIPGHLPHQLATWWERGEGAAKIGWGTPGSFMRCVRLAEEEAHMTPERAKGFCAERYHAATGKWPGEHHHAGRASVTTPGDYDADGLDGSWDDCSDLPDMTGLGVEHVQAAEKAMGINTPPDQPAQRAMPKLGTGARFAKLKSSLAAKGARDPGALAAYIGRRKFGKAKFAKIAAKARGKAGSSRMETPRAEHMYFRTYGLEDIHIVRSGQGDATGRLVEAYAAVFDSAAEIQDFEGHYTEEIDPGAFNKVLADISRSRAGLGKVKVMYNHGMTIHGTPSERGSMPIGTPVSIQPETRGLLTLTRYSETPFADEILENIRNGAITAQSFTGRIVRSDPQLARGDRYRPRAGKLPLVRRMELGLKEFGPTPFEAYSDAEIVGVRMSTPGTWEPDEEQVTGTSPDEEAAAGEPLTPDGEHSARYHQHALYRLRSQKLREEAGLDW
jgi:HK97 family phage prohead protease